MRSTLFFILCVFLFSSSFSSGENKRPSSIPGFEPDVPNLMQARDKVYTGGQPTPEGMQRLSALGIKLIVNLRPHDEKGARDESSEAAAYGMKYINIPLTGASFTREKIHQFSELLKDQQNYPVYIHCKSGNRVGGAWLVHRVQQEGAEVSEAIEEGKAIGLQPELEPIVLQLLDQSNED